MKKKEISRKTTLGLLLLTLCFTTTGCSSCSRGLKSIASDIDGGLNRTVTVYDYNGEEIKSWSGKFDISESTDEVYFDDQNGKRIIIHGGIVISEEN